MRTLLLALTLLLPLPAIAGNAATYQATQGGVLIIPLDFLTPASVIEDDGTFPKALYCNGEKCAVLVAIDMKREPGNYTDRLLCYAGSASMAQELTISVTKGEFKEQKLTLPKKYVEPDKEIQERAKKESALIREAMAHPDSRPVMEKFSIPVAGEISTTFGAGRILNGQPRNQHSGVDIKASFGEKVRAVSRGRVVLTGHFFFNGKSVFIDHGNGVYSMYFHLSEIAVTTGDELVKGAVIGRIGSTGRSTGAHLHFGMKIKSATIDPLRFIAALKAK